jgi:molybdopterin converting factor subunit 1
VKRITLLYFAALRDLVGTASEELEVDDSIATVRALTGHLCQRYAGLQQRLPSVRIARNEQFVNEAEPISSGDTIALIPPVAGG